MNTAAPRGDLLRRVQIGDHAAFTSLLRDCDERMRRLAHRMSGESAGADDALQDAYVKAYRNLPGFDGRSAFATWLYTIVYRTCLDQIRSRNRRAEVDLSAAEEPSTAGDHATRHEGSNDPKEWGRSRMLDRRRVGGSDGSCKYGRRSLLSCHSTALIAPHARQPVGVGGSPSKERMSEISSELTLPCGDSVKNRLCKAAMTEGVADAHNRATDRHVTLYRRWAEGGAGVLLTGNVQVDRRYLERAGNIVIDGPQDEASSAALEAMAEAGTVADTHLWMQLSHAGRQTPKLVATEPVGPSDIPVAIPGGRFGKPRALTGEEIREVIERFAYAAGVAKQTGFTGVQVHAAHGYLLSEFLSPRVNVRDDEWGGSLENRARLLIATVRAVRAAVGPALAVSVKLNSADFQKGGFSFEDCLEVIALLNEEGLDLLEISGGNYEQPRLMGIDGLEPVFEEKVQESTRAREAYFFDYAVAASAVAKMPLMVTGGFRSTTGMNEALSVGDVDMIGVARPLCIDPDFPSRVLSGELDQADDVETDLRIGPGLLGPNSPVATIKAINGFAKLGWYYEQIYRLADGRQPDPSMSALRALLAYDRTEKTKARELARS